MRTLGRRLRRVGGRGLGAAVVALLGVVAPAGAIVGGGPVGIADFPYQAALVESRALSATDGQFCGGTIRDATHVVTAAHCVFDNPLTAAGQNIDPAVLYVLVGTTLLSAENTAGQRLDVLSVAVDPDYDSATTHNDAAVLTLATPITHAAARPLTIPTTTEWSAVPPGTNVVVSGWGAMTAPPQPPPGTDPASGSNFPDQLQAVQVPLVSDSSCGAAYGGTFDPGSQTCAGLPQGGKDACQGDSGGPLALQRGAAAPADRLVGIVSIGFGCAFPGFPGIYTEVGAPAINAFVTDPEPAVAPVAVTASTLTSSTGDTATAGSVLSCSPGTWQHANSFAFQFARGTTPLSTLSRQATYTVQPADAGSTIVCDVRAAGGGGVAFAQSNGIAVQEPAQPPATPPQQPPLQPVLQDTNAPVARITTAHCVRARCTIELSVTDAGFSAGIKRVGATLVSSYRTTCRKNARLVACTKKATRTLKATQLSPTRFRLVVSRLRIGTHAFSITAVDQAGNVQRLPTRRTLRTSRR